MSVKYVPPQTPLLYSKTGVCRGIPTFLIFAPKHRLWVLGSNVYQICIGIHQVLNTILLCDSENFINNGNLLLHLSFLKGHVS